MIPLKYGAWEKIAEEILLNQSKTRSYKMKNTTIEVAVSDINNHISHILKVIKSRKKPLELEIYDDVLLLVYNDIEMPVKILKPSRKSHNLRAKYKILDKSPFFNFIKKCNDLPTIKLTFTEKSMDASVAGTTFSFDIQSNFTQNSK